MPAILATAQYNAVDSKSLIKFTIKNFGINTGGTFTGLDGAVVFDPSTPGSAHFTVSIDANTVNTDNSLRDSHLKGEDYFDVAHYPRISLESNKVAAMPDKNTFILFGKLTIKNHTQDVSFPFTAQPSGNGYLFKGSFTINRRDFGVGGFSTISENAEINLSVFASK